MNNIRERWRLRRTIKAEHDLVSAGMAVGALVPVPLLLGSLTVSARAVAALAILDGVVLLAAAYFHLRALQLLGVPQSFPTAVNTVVFPILVLMIGVGLAARSHGVFKPYTTDWWGLVAASLILAASFARRRRGIDLILEELARADPATAGQSSPSAP